MPSINTSVIALALALAPESSPPRATFDVADAEFLTGDSSTHLLTYDSEGEVAAEIIVWVDSNDQQRLDAMFADGLYMTAIIADENVTIETDDAEEVAARVEAIGDYLGDDQQQGKAWVPCAWSVVGTVTSCAAVRPILCPASAIVMSCNCLPLIVEEWEDEKCPGFG